MCIFPAVPFLILDVGLVESSAETGDQSKMRNTGLTIILHVQAVGYG